MSSTYFQLFRSQLKIDLLSSLLESEKNLSSLRNELGSSGSTIIHALSDLENLKLTERDEKKYKLTPLGYIQALLVEELNFSFSTLEKFEGFWFEHDVSAIPQNLLKRIGDLEKSILIQNDSEELDRVHTTFQKILLTSKEVFGVSPIFHSDFVKAFQKLLIDGAKVELILSSGVLEKALSQVEYDLLTEYISTGYLRIFLSDDLRIALTVTENSFSMGLFRLNGGYDYTRDIISNDIKAIKWGKDLFNHFIERSVMMNSNDLNNL